MLFNSLGFTIFLPTVFFLYWFVIHKNLRQQNILLLGASYFFYGCWDTRFLLLLLFSTALDFFSAIQLAKAKSVMARKMWFWLSISINLGFLGIFKYYNFFVESLKDVLNAMGWQVDTFTLQVILPVGISFYTFHGLSYLIDVYKSRIQPERNPVDYALFVGFFPLLVAGPIERATHLLPQIKKSRPFDSIQMVDGLKQILWGFVKKMAIADSCAYYVNQIFPLYESLPASVLLWGAFLFAIQIYGDFSGYSDIALGCAKLFGIELLRNFNYPYFSRNMAEFWKRWHISLSSWFRDYLYIPLGGSKGGIWIKIRNTFIVFLVSALWHGANWTFLVWGGLHALYFLPLLLWKNNRNYQGTVAQGKILPSFREFCQMTVTFGLTMFAWIFFRAPNLKVAIGYISNIFNASILAPIEGNTAPLLLLLIVFMTVEWLGREDGFAIAKVGQNMPRPLRWLFYMAATLLVFYTSGNEQPFIYFQF